MASRHRNAWRRVSSLLLNASITGGSARSEAWLGIVPVPRQRSERGPRCGPRRQRWRRVEYCSGSGPPCAPCTAPHARTGAQGTPASRAGRTGLGGDYDVAGAVALEQVPQLLQGIREGRLGGFLQGVGSLDPTVAQAQLKWVKAIERVGHSDRRRAFKERLAHGRTRSSLRRCRPGRRTTRPPLAGQGTQDLAVLTSPTLRK